MKYRDTRPLQFADFMARKQMKDHPERRVAAGESATGGAQQK